MPLWDRLQLPLSSLSSRTTFLADQRVPPRLMRGSPWNDHLVKGRWQRRVSSTAYWRRRRRHSRRCKVGRTVACALAGTVMTSPRWRRARRSTGCARGPYTCTARATPFQSPHRVAPSPRSHLRAATCPVALRSRWTLDPTSARSTARSAAVTSGIPASDRRSCCIEDRAHGVQNRVLVLHAPPAWR